ncbi:MAG TPA: hypothetical protein P5550_00330 [Bacteroidales bacterium]|nr:hypothetical protein [Bacteroidales bacterium]
MDTGQFNYKDLYRFLVSAGVILIVAAVALPVLLLRDPDSFYLSSDAYQGVSDIAKATLATRFRYLGIVICSLWWVVGLVFVAGAVLIIIGIKKWIKKQKIDDETQKEYLRNLKLSTASLEVRSKRETLEFLNQSPIPKEEPVPEDNGQDVEQSEELVEESENVGDRYEITDEHKKLVQELVRFYLAEWNLSYNLKINALLNNQRVSDVVLISEIEGKYSDKIVHLYLFEQGATIQEIKQEIIDLVKAQDVYKEKFKTVPRAILIITLPNHLSPDHIKTLQENVGALRKGFDPNYITIDLRLQKDITRQRQSYLR